MSEHDPTKCPLNTGLIQYKLDMAEKQHKEINVLLHEMRNDQVEIKVQLGQLRVKSGVWGLLGGAISVVIGLGFWMIKK